MMAASEAMWPALAALAGAVAGWAVPSLARALIRRWNLRHPAGGGARRLPAWHRPALSLSGAAAAAGAAAVYGLQWRLALVCVALGWLLLVAAVDLQTHLIPNRLTYPALLLAPLWVAIWPGATIADHIVGGLLCAGFFVLALLASPRGIGLGDVKLALSLGLYLGTGRGLVALVTTLLLGGLAALVALAGGLDRKDAIPYGPLLAGGGALALIAGDRLWAAYLAHLGLG
jgi:leader peptidase (prepilin peptidase)/N-methyltransferase